MAKGTDYSAALQQLKQAIREQNPDNLYFFHGEETFLLHHYLEQLKKVLIQQVLETPNLPTGGLSHISVDIRIRMLLSGVIDAYREWLAGGIDYSLEEMTAEVASIIQTWSRN